MNALLTTTPRCVNPPPSSTHPCRRNWLCVWTCLQRARQGPWTLDVSRLSRAAAPEGVLLLLELLLTSPPPPPAGAAVAVAAPCGSTRGGTSPRACSGEAGCVGAAPAGTQAAPAASPPVAAGVSSPGGGSGGSSHAGWVAPIPVVSLVLDGHQVVVLVEPSGR
jgi:hypothetical protein